MKLAGSSALTRVAQNPQCGWLVAMIRSGKNEPEFYKKLMGKNYPKEYGERLSARRRGAKFERNAYANNAALLREALSGLIGVPAKDIWVRNLEDEEPGGREANRVKRLNRTRNILKDHVDGKPTAHILIQPQLRITHGGLIAKPGVFIAPDVLFLHGVAKRYRPADLKSFVVRGHHVEPADLERSRLQVASQSIALHEALAELGDTRAPEHVGGFIFATPYGLAPHEPKLELLEGSVDCVLKAIKALEYFGHLLDAAKVQNGAASDHLVLDAVPNHFQERCISACALAEYCREHHAGKAHELGDASLELLGPDIDLDRAVQLLHGAAPKTDHERKVADMLADLSKAFHKIGVAA